MSDPGPSWPSCSIPDREDVSRSDRVFLFLIETICCDPSFELSRRDGSDEGHNICFYVVYKNFSYLSSITLSYLELWYMYHVLLFLFQIVKMLVTVVVLFALCWLPLHIFFFVLNFTAKEHHPNLTLPYFICHWIAMSNSFVNPIVYVLLNDSFRVSIFNFFD